MSHLSNSELSINSSSGFSDSGYNIGPGYHNNNNSHRNSGGYYYSNHHKLYTNNSPLHKKSLQNSACSVGGNRHGGGGGGGGSGGGSRHSGTGWSLQTGDTNSFSEDSSSFSMLSGEFE